MSEHREPGREPKPKLLQKPWPELPPRYESVFHYTDQTSLDSIAQDGIRHFSEREKKDQLSESQRHLLAFDTYCDKIAEELGIDARRAQSVFLALPPALDRSKWSRFGNVNLEVKTDAHATYVFDRKLHSFGAIAFYKTPEGQQWLEADYPSGSKERREVERMLQDEVTQDWQKYIERYFREAVTLATYLSLSEEARERFEMPEVAVRSPVEPKFIRIAK